MQICDFFLSAFQLRYLCIYYLFIIYSTVLWRMQAHYTQHTHADWPCDSNQSVYRFVRRTKMLTNNTYKYIELPIYCVSAIFFLRLRPFCVCACMPYAESGCSFQFYCRPQNAVTLISFLSAFVLFVFYILFFLRSPSSSSLLYLNLCERFQ